HRRTLSGLYPELYTRRLTDKTAEVVANIQRDGSRENAKANYERMMSEVFAECRRVLKSCGILTLMFTHKSQDAWESLTHALIVSGWTITGTFPVESEFANSRHLLDTASAESSIFLACRKRPAQHESPATWSGFGGTGVQQRIRSEVQQGLK